jgi:hypothetical protein
MESEQFTMRAPCQRCHSETGKIVQSGGQNVVRCYWCGTFAYNAPKTETGERKRSVTTVHNGIKPKQRARLILRSGGRCELCGNRAPLHIGHLVSVEDGLASGLTEVELNDDANLIPLCEECNLGLGSLSATARLLVSIALRIEVRRATA